MNFLSGKKFFAEQSYCGVADDNGTVVGLYILHPNNIGRLGGISNASYAVDYDLNSHRNYPIHSSVSRAREV